MSEVTLKMDALLLIIFGAVVLIGLAGVAGTLFKDDDRMDFRVFSGGLVLAGGLCLLGVTADVMAAGLS